MILKQATNYTRVFPMFQSAAPQTPLTGATVAVNISKNGGAFAAAANSPATQISAGLYSILLTTVDTANIGELAFSCTATGGNPTIFVDQVQTQIFTDLLLDAFGNVAINSSIKKNQALNGFMFLMTNNLSHAPQTGLTVSAQRSLGGAGFANCANLPVVELANGIYTINLAASDLNANSIMFRFTAPGADDLDLLILTQP
jgi:hypothetical protein